MDLETLIFNGIHFFLAGFDSLHFLQVKSNIVNEGGVVVDEYGPRCTHVVVHNLVSDDIICDTARRDGKTLVTSLWLEHSLYNGVPADAKKIIYRPLRGLTGIPGADKFKISITGYEGAAREDIKAMVSLMGAELSKQLRADETTHLVCYMFEGDKYRLAKLRPYTKIVNHQWLKDCLLNWKILPEDPYSTKSGYEISIMGDQAEDSEDESRDVSGRNKSWITDLQHEMGDAPNHFMVAGQVPILSRQEGISNSSIINDEMLPKFDLLSESGNVSELDKQHAHCQRDHAHVVANSETAKGQSIAPPFNQIVSDAPSTSGNRKNSADFNVELLDNSKYLRKILKKSTLSSKTSSRSRASLKPAGKFSKSSINDVPTSSSHIENEEATSCDVVVPDSKKLNKSVSCKQNPLNSRDSSVSLKSAGMLNNLDEELEKGVAEKVIADVHTTNKDAGLVDDNSLGASLPRKRTADGSKVSHDTLKSQKLTTSASKRVDAAEPITPVSNPLKKRKSGGPDSVNRIGQESHNVSSGRSSPNVSSSKSNEKNVVPFRSLDFESLQGSKPMNSDVLVSPNGNSGVSTSPGMKSKMSEPANTHQHVTDSSGINDLEAVKSGSPKLNCDQTGSSVSKPPRRKMVARKTLGSKPKLSKTSADAQKSSFSRNSSGDDAAIHQKDQENREDPSHSDEVHVASVVDEPVHLGSRPNLKSATNLIDYQKLEETKASPELGINNQKHLNPEWSFDVLHQVSDSVSDKTSGQDMLEIVEMKQILVSQKKEKAVKTKKKTLLTAKEKSKNADEGEAGNISDKEKDQVVGAATKKQHGTLISTSAEVENENGDELVGNNDAEVRKENEILNDQHVNVSGKNVKGLGKLENRRAGTQVLKKSKGAVQKQNENVPVYQGDESIKHGEKCPAELAATSNTRQSDVEINCKSDPSVENDQGASKVLKRPGKLAGKKRRGTLLLRKKDFPDEANKGNVPVSDGGQHPTQVGGASGIFDRSMEVEDNVPILGENQGKKKGGNRSSNLAGKKRRGTLVLNKDEAQFDDEKENEPVLDDDEDKSQAGIPTGKAASKSNLTGMTSSESKAELNLVKKHELNKEKKQSACFIVSGHRLQRKEFQQLIKRLKGKVCRDSHQWSYQATHFIVPDPIRRTEKFFAAAASGSWILKTDYLTASSQAGKLLPEEPYEWHKNGLTEDGAISLEAPRKWRLLRERTGHGAFYGMQIIIYGECIAPPLETLKRVVKAGDGTILATSPPYTRFLQAGVDFAIVSPGMPRVDMWVQEFLRHQIPCVLADYLVEYVCKPGYSLDRHVQYSTHEWAAKSFSKLLSLSEEVVIADAPSDGDATPDNQVSEDLACQVCGLTDREEVMLVCGDERGSLGCGIGTHIDCCDPPLEDIPEGDWFCPKCTDSSDDFPGLS